MHQSFISFGVGLLLAIVLVYLILMAQFASFIDPFIILLAIPSGITGVILFLLITHTTLNVMSLMGVIMMTGIVVSNSILIVDVTRNYRKAGMPIREAVALACRVRLRPILMTSLATILGLIPMALALEAGSEQYAPLARSIIGGLDRFCRRHCFPRSCGLPLIHRHEENQPGRRCRRDDARSSCLRLSLLIFASLAVAQDAMPSAPVPQTAAPTPQTATPAAPTDQAQPRVHVPANGPRQRLTLQDAEALAIKKQPADFGFPPALPGLEPGHPRAECRLLSHPLRQPHRRRFQRGLPHRCRQSQ